MRNILTFFSILLFSTAFAQTGWKTIPISGSVQVAFPEIPQTIDTLGQKVIYLRQGDEMMMSTVAPINKEIMLSDTFNMDKLISNFVNDIVSGANVLIFSDVVYKGVAAKYCKVRVDDEYHALRGLILDSYTFSLKDTLYSIAYWRYNATEMYDYSKQRTFYDKIELKLDSASIQIMPMSENSNSSFKNDTSTKTPYWIIFLVLAAIGLGSSVYFYKRKTQQTEFPNQDMPS